MLHDFRNSRAGLLECGASERAELWTTLVASQAVRWLALDYQNVIESKRELAYDICVRRMNVKLDFDNSNTISDSNNFIILFTQLWSS